MSLRIWLHEGHDGEPGVVALGLDHVGFATWADSRDALIAKVAGKFEEYRAWRARHGLAVESLDPGLEVAGELVGDEILFPPDRDAATREEIELTLRLLEASRADLVAELEAAPSEALDWDPPYERFASWADWRTVRANLAHVANGETHYYARNIGHETARPPADPHGDWRAFLPESRAETVVFLNELARSDDLGRVGSIDYGRGEEFWSVRKALRRMVSHEVVHTKSIARIFRDYRALHAGHANGEG